VTQKDRSAFFTGVARDCAAHLPGVLENLGRFAASYRAASFLFVVSDSKDDTRAILERWLADGRSGRVIDLGTLEGRLTRRTERIAFARNAGLDAIDAGHDHLVVTDLDDVLAPPVDAGAFARAAAWLDGDPARAGVMANAMPRYYDVWALRHERWCPDDCWHPIWGRPPDETFEAAKFREVFTRQIEIPPSLPPIAVRSAFGGLGIYRLPAALAARYHGVDADGRETSEHVAFNTAIGRAGGQLHIFPALQVHAPRQHLYQPSEFKWRWRMTMMARRTAEIARPSWRRMLAPT
jgi:glycosyltransferase involved in cell wall biosynthesis